MLCCHPIWPNQWTPPDEVPPGKVNQVSDLTGQIETNRRLYWQLPSEYHARPIVRVIASIVVIVGFAIMLMALNHTLSSFPQNCAHFFQHNWGYVVGGIVLLVPLTGGAMMVIRHVIHKQDYRITEQGIGKLTGDDHWVAAMYTTKDNGGMPGYIDTSTVDGNGDGKAFFYAHKQEMDHYQVCLAVIAFTPVHVVGAIAYNILRLFIMPLYIGGCIIRDLFRDPPKNDKEAKLRFRATDIIHEGKRSLSQMASAIFYGWGIILAALYAFADPLNGRKLGAYLEWEWNQGVTRAEGYWSVGGPQDLFEFEGSGVRGRLGRTGFFIAGCWQPMGVVEIRNHKIVSEGTSLSRAVNPKEGSEYTFHTAKKLTANHSEYIKDLNSKLRRRGASKGAKRQVK